MTPAQTREIPFWGWQDIAVFAGLLVPSLIVAAAAALLSVWASNSVLYLLLLGAIAMLFRTRYDAPFWPSLGWTVPRQGALACLLAGPLVAMTVGGLGALLRTPLKEMPLEKLIHGPFAIYFFGLFSVILGPVFEELVFRGFLMPVAVRSFGVWPGIIIAALPFALLHGPEYAWTWQYVLLIGFAGSVFGAVRHYLRSTLASALMHSTYNLTFFVALLVRQGHPQ